MELLTNLKFLQICLGGIKVTWEDILKGEIIRKQDSDEIAWEMDTQGHHRSWVNFGNLPEGVVDTDVDLWDFRIIGEYYFKPRDNYIYGESRLEKIAIEGRLRLLYDPDDENAPRTHGEFSDPEEEVDFNLEEESDFDNDYLGEWGEGKVNPLNIDVQIDMKKSKNPDDWELILDAIEWAIPRDY